MNEKIDKKKWFDIPDSKTKGDDGNVFYNVEARFADHPVVNIPASKKIGLGSVYDLVPQLHMHVKKNIFGNRAIVNSTSVVFQFQKGRDETAATTQVIGPTGAMVPNRVGKVGLSKADIDRLASLIMRCREAWEHYQKFRQAPIWPLEEDVVKIIAQKPKAAKGVLVIAGRTGRTDSKGEPVYDLIEYDQLNDDNEEDHFDPDGDNMPEDIVLAAPVKGKPGRKAKAA